MPTSSLLQPVPLTAADYLLLSFVSSWIVGFTIAEGSFLIKSNQDACFQIKQRSHKELFKAFQLIFNTNRKIGIELNQYMQFSVSSKKDIQSVINFFSHGDVSLMGYKQTQYLNWIQYLKNSAAPAELLIFYPAVAWQPPGMGRRSLQKLGAVIDILNLNLSNTHKLSWTKQISLYAGN